MTAQHDVGPLAEEAARFVEALSEWARGRVGPLAGAGASVGHSSECALCPVCQLLGVLRSAKPETFAHLLEASAAMTAALRSVMESHGGGASASGFERITLDDDLLVDPMDPVDHMDMA